MISQLLITLNIISEVLIIIFITFLDALSYSSIEKLVTESDSKKEDKVRNLNS